MYLTLDIIKKHLYIDDYFTDDDDYIIGLANVAEKVVEKHIDSNLSELADEEGHLPSPLCQAMLLFIGNMYQNREAVSYSSPTELPLAFNYIISLYKNYSNENNSL